MTRKDPNSTTERLKALGVEADVTITDDNDIDIQTVAESDLASLASDEAFMNERIKIRLATTTDPNAPPVADVTVNNAANRAIIPRGEIVSVKRLHVEVLARMRETRFVQPQRDMMNPEAGNSLLGRTAMVYPFEIIEDKNPKGRVWLENILAERA